MTQNEIYSKLDLLTELEELQACFQKSRGIM